MSKTQYIIIKNRQNNYVLPQNLLFLDNTAIEETDNVKFLGVLIDRHLSFKQHTENLQERIHPYIGLLYRCSQFLPKQILTLIYNSYINSKINYCIEAYGTANKSTLKYHTHFAKKDS